MSTSGPRRGRRFRPGPASAVILLWAVAMLPLLRWGLPDGGRDSLLFGGDPPWPAERYAYAADLERLREQNIGTDTDLNPLADRANLVHLTATEADRAEILRRYRLFSRQPDEMIIFRALQRMDPRKLDFDPHLYQYGGAYLYLVALLLVAGKLVGLVHLTSDLGVYLANPVLFGNFYVAARLLSLASGAAALLAVHRLGCRTGHRTVGWLALVTLMATPVFVSAVVEAKPHMPSAALALWATLSALDYASKTRTVDAIRMGFQAGFSLAMVLTGAVVLLLWPALLIAAWHRARRALRDLAMAGAIAAATFFAMNPYLLLNPEARESNIRNSTAMYAGQLRHAAAGAARVAELTGESCGWLLPLLGIAGLGLLFRRWRTTALVGSAAGLGMLLMAALLGAGKPAEYARFLILPASLLCVAGGYLILAAARRKLWLGLVLTLLSLAMMRTPAYVRAILTDARDMHESRRLAAAFLAEPLAASPALAVLQEPAPYAVPPVDFTRLNVWLLPASAPRSLDPAMLPEWLVFTADDAGIHATAWWHAYYEPTATFPPEPPSGMITWANKPVFVFRRAE